MNLPRSVTSALMVLLPLFSASAFYDDTVETHAQVKNVKVDFGAVADGSTEDSAAFQTAIDWISANWGGRPGCPL